MALHDIPFYYFRLVHSIIDLSGATDSTLHIHAGLVIWLLATLATRKSLSSPVPLAIVLAAEVCNEIFDRLNYGSWRWDDTLLDLLNTMFWPLVLVTILHLVQRPSISRRQ